LQLSAKAEVFPRQHDGRAMIADSSADDDDVTVRYAAQCRSDARQPYPHSGRREIQSAALSSPQHLGVARAHFNAGFFGRPRETADDAIEF
jgi:hypothetical protein